MSENLFNYKFIGVDIGGSHITAALISPEQCTIDAGSKVRRRVDAKGDAVSILKTWAEVLNSFIRADDNKHLLKVGIAMPGPFDYQKGISLIKGLNKYDALYSLDIREALSSATGLEPSNILFRNDAEAFLHGEVIFGKIPSNVKVIGVTLGTGLGSAVSMNSITRDVFRAITPMYESIAEEYISTRWFQKRFKELTGRFLIDVEALLSEDELIKSQLFAEFGKNLGLFLDSFVSDENADIIIIGGNIARCLDYFKEEMLGHISSPDVQVRQSILWENAALIGAACSYHEAEELAKTANSGSKVC
ncbi:ROK family protein [Pedobacter sp. BS3]|uniref:ROK family protein n=1 Tax=Pedobacter sp. BS3 TaxID=2567937 RepID=UPI0011EC0984|nr:ROK family protein [Pedobacter sp. BS3]TZF82626.1 ROK family protein [Pedobacter sp. BS3]